MQINNVTSNNVQGNPPCLGYDRGSHRTGVIIHIRELFCEVIQRGIGQNMTRPECKKAGADVPHTMRPRGRKTDRENTPRPLIC